MTSPISLSEVPQVRAQPADHDLVAHRRQQIVVAAAELFSRKGFEATTVSEIAAAAGISTGLIYHYARTKEDVLFLVLLTVVDSYRIELPPAMAAFEQPVDKLRAGVRAYCGVIDRKMDETMLTYRTTKVLPRAHRETIKQAEIDTNALIENCIRDGISAGQFRDVDPVIAAYQFVAFAHNWALKSWRLHALVTLDEYFAAGFDMLLRGIVTPQGWELYQARLAADGARGPAADDKQDPSEGKQHG